ncbi:hypothetical protein N8258_01270 [Algibacter sp.]|nr:hypothetical protein [Algibacter sp.]MDA9069189.1 hypothetical protein [Algibacter sp.]MDC1365029.1 hypothetical protein [Algibacter sp.]
MIPINNFEELISYLKTPDLTNEQITQIVAKSMGVHLYTPKLPPRKRLIELLIKYYVEWRGKHEKPLFIDDENDIII